MALTATIYVVDIDLADHDRNVFDSFSLRAGLSEFAIGKLTMIDAAEPGKVRIRLDGQAGARYVVEKNVGNSEWLPIKVFTNASGGVTEFDDDRSNNGEVAIYRSRIVD